MCKKFLIFFELFLIMKKIIKVLFIFLSIEFLSCKSSDVVPNENIPSVITNEASELSLQCCSTDGGFGVVKLSGEVNNEGAGNVTERGFVYSDKNSNPMLGDSKIQSGFGSGFYFSKLEKLPLNTKFYFKSYATNLKGTAYGAIKNFTTLDYKLATLQTENPTSVTYASVNVIGKVIDSGGANIIERGFCFGLNVNPAISDNKISVSLNGMYIDGTGSFTANLYNMKSETKYYIRAYAVNEKGVNYGNEQVITTLKSPTIWYDNYTEVVDVVSKTGRIWMDRNLGAKRAASGISDFASFGDLYQWGRRTDGHQDRFSGTILELNRTAQPAHGLFNLYPGPFFVPMNYNLWQGINGENNPCPLGYRLPTKNELDEERKSWKSNNSEGAFNSPLKLPTAGYRNVNFEGRIDSEGSAAFYYSSSVEGKYIWGLSIKNSDSQMSGTGGTFGYCVRCIKN
jgi:uncharacterized protein (TIGR02145 family)